MEATEATAEKRRCDCRAIEFLESSIGKKIMVALAGILLCGFLVTHLLGNLLLFVGAGAFNHYAATLEHNPLLPIAEIGLTALFLIHIALATRAWLANRAARPVGYQAYSGKGARTPGSRSMAASGSLVLLFLIVHLRSFRFAEKSVRETDMYQLVTSAFTNPLYAGFYVLAMIAVGLHLSHGVQSAFQTFGLSHPRYTPLIKKAGWAFAAVMMLAFASMPIYFFFVGGAK